MGYFSEEPAPHRRGASLPRGCVTRRKHRPRPVNFSQKTVTVQACLPAGREGMARVFAVMVQILLRTGAIAVQI